MSGRNSKYVEAAVSVLEELGGGPVPSQTLIKAIVEKGLLADRKYLYHNVLRRVRESELFDTSMRGWVSLAKPVVVEEPMAPAAEPENAVMEKAVGSF